MRHTTMTALAFAALTAPAFAQEETTIQVGESDQYGQHLTTGDGRAVYVFTTDTQGSDGQDAMISCTTDDCMAAWPFVTAEGEPQAGDGVESDMLGTVDHDGETVVTYNGWPLYHFVRDKGADAPQGHEVESFGGEWYLVTPEGEQLEAEQ